MHTSKYISNYDRKLIMNLLLLGDPLDVFRFSFQFQHVLLTFLGAEVENLAVVLDEHDSCSLFYVIITKAAFHYLTSSVPDDSISVSLSIRMSPILTGPTTFLISTFPLSLPSIILHLTWDTPFIPDLPRSCTTSAGTESLGTGIQSLFG